MMMMIMMALIMLMIIVPCKLQPFTEGLMKIVKMTAMLMGKQMLKIPVYMQQIQMVNFTKFKSISLARNQQGNSEQHPVWILSNKQYSSEIMQKVDNHPVVLIYRVVQSACPVCSYCVNASFRATPIYGHNIQWDFVCK